VSMEEVVGPSRASPWEATPLNYTKEESHLQVVGAHLFASGNRMFLFGGFPQQQLASKDFLEELRSFMVDKAGRALSGWDIVHNREVLDEVCMSKIACALFF
jgi:hypothetical protein